MTKIRKNKQKHPQKKGLLILVILLAGFLAVLPVHAQTVADAVQQVADSLGNMEYDYISAESTDFNIPVYYCAGAYQNGQAGIYALGPLTAEEKQAVTTQLFDYSGSTGSATTPLKGGEVRRYAMEDQVFVSVILNDYMVVVQIYETGNSAEQDFQTATEYAQLMLDSFEKNGLLGGKAPELEAARILPAMIPRMT